MGSFVGDNKEQEFPFKSRGFSVAIKVKSL